MKVLLHSFLLCLLLLSPELLAQTGKIAGVVKDAQTGEPIIGANIILEGTQKGAATDPDGYYVILNIPPGKYSLRASVIGYTAQTVSDIRVNINLTTEINFDLSSQDYQTSEFVVVAKTPVVQKDISATTANLSREQFENLPVASLSSVVGMQVGSDGLAFRGGDLNQTAFMVNGLTMRDERNNQPFSAISLTAIDEIQIQTGGFNAEYGNIRSGLVNVVTKEGKTDRYSVSFYGRYRPEGKKYFGSGPSDPNSYWLRPFLDDAVAWTGTASGAWDEYMRKQYPDFKGWNKVSQDLLADNNPNNDLTPEAAQRLFLWQHRKDTRITNPDYDYDLSVAGPVPGISRYLGNLRFLASIRGSRNYYIIPLATDNYHDYTAQVRLTSDVGPGMKLSLESLYNRMEGTTSTRDGSAGVFASASGIASVLRYSKTSYGDSRIYSTDYWSPTSSHKYSFGGKFSHAISQYTFYEVTANSFTSKYFTNPGRKRDNTKRYEIVPGVFTDEAPVGFEDEEAFGIGSAMRMGVGMSNGRDSSRVTATNVRFDFTTQLDKFNQIKTGAEFNYSDNNINYGQFDKVLPSNNTRYVWHTFPVRAAVYAQDKIEFEGMIANIGLRLDYSNANTDWYVFNSNFESALSGANASKINELLKKEPTKAQIILSPRIGVAFPITETSKLYFNYGHFRQMPLPEDLYMIRQNSYTKKIVEVSDPNVPLEKTVAYELGYEQSLMDEYHIRVAGYYRDISDQTRLVNYINRDNSVNYDIPRPDSYADVRGFEVTFSKLRGNWFQGMVNYNYRVSSSGYFNLSTYYENPSEQRVFERNTRENYQSKPLPRPEAKANLDFFTPTSDFGPEFAGNGLFTDWRLSLIGTWRNGYYLTWYGGSGVAPKGSQNNLQWNDYWNVDLRLSKNFKFGPANLQLFVDVSNVFNYKYMYDYGFVDNYDYIDYMQSLHLKKDITTTGYTNIPGDDRPGDYSKGGTFTPIRPEQSLANVSNPSNTLIYYEVSSQKYYQYSGSEWKEVESSKMQKILDDKSYIDMPNQSYLSFLNLRNIYWGLKVSFEL